MQKYVCGFTFNEKMDQVALIHKRKPAWQAGKVNGIGGKMNDDESAANAMEREYHEEAGLLIPSEMWDTFVIMSGKGWRVYFMRAFGIDLRAVKTMEEEPVAVYAVSFLPPNVIHNLRWLIPMALDTDLKTPIDIFDRTTNGA